MPIRHQSFIKDGDKKENKILSDIIVAGSSRGKLSFKSKDADYFMTEYPLKDQYTKEECGMITALLKAENNGLKLFDCDLTIDAKPKKIHLLELLPASGKANEHYLAEATEFHTPPFVIETVNRYAVWDDNLEGKDVNVGLSAFAFRVVVHDNIDEFNKQFDIFPIDTENGPLTGFSEDFAVPKDEQSESPYTFFLGKVLDVKDVKIKLTKYKIEFSIIYVDCFLGTLKVVAGKNTFDLSKLEKGKILEISADIKADFGVDPTPEALSTKSIKKTENTKKPEKKHHSVLRKRPWISYNPTSGKKVLGKHSSKNGKK